MRHHRRITGSGLNAHMDDQAITMQRLRTLRRCQRTVGRLVDELNEVARQVRAIWMEFPSGSREALDLHEAVINIDVMMVQGDKVTGGIDDFILAGEAKGQAHNG